MVYGVVFQHLVNRFFAVKPVAGIISRWGWGRGNHYRAIIQAEIADSFRAFGLTAGTHHDEREK